MKTVIIGGVAAGASCAARLRRLDESAEIVILEKSGYVSYANCGLPYYVGRKIEKFDSLLVQTASSLYRRFRIDVRLNSEVLGVNTAKKYVVVCQEGKVTKENYDNLVITSGCSSRQLFDQQLPTLRSIDDIAVLEEQIGDKKSVAIIGGGFVGIELAENLIRRGREVTVFEYESHVMPNYDKDIVSYAEKELRDNGVRLVTGARVENVVKNEKYVITVSGEVREYDFVVLLSGIIPNTGFLKDSGIRLDGRGYVEVDEHMRTNIEGVYAGGDVCVVRNYVTEKDSYIPLAGPANRQGRIIADNIAGLQSAYDGSLGTNIIKIFSLSMAGSGLNKRQLDREGYDYETICLHPSSHASYYPGATPIHAKLFYDRAGGRILGIQAIGREGVDKLVDVIATVMKLNGTVYDLTRLELSYAPPYLSAKSPANYFGFVAENVLNGLETLVTVEEALKETDDHVLLDVRTQGEYDRGHFRNSLHIPVDSLRERMNELEPYRDKVIDVYCAVGIRGHIASRILMANGYKTRNITGAYTTYSALK